MFKPVFLASDFDAAFDAPDCFQEARAAIEAQLFVQPRPGTKAADLTASEKMWLLRAANVPLRPVMNGTMFHLMTVVPCAIVDGDDGRYIVVVGRA